MKTKIYHNPACGTSRNALAIIRNTGEEPEIIEYLITPPTKKQLIALIKNAGLSVRQSIRENVEPFQTLQLAQDHWSDDQLIDFMLQHPILINRPFVITDLGVKLCRPSELVLDLLSTQQRHPLRKEDGEMIIDQELKRLK